MNKDRIPLTFYRNRFWGSDFFFRWEEPSSGSPLEWQRLAATLLYFAARMKKIRHETGSLNLELNSFLHVFERPSEGVSNVLCKQQQDFSLFPFPFPYSFPLFLSLPRTPSLTSPGPSTKKLWPSVPYPWSTYPWSSYPRIPILDSVLFPDLALLGSVFQASSLWSAHRKNMFHRPINNQICMSQPGLAHLWSRPPYWPRYTRFKLTFSCLPWGCALRSIRKKGRMSAVMVLNLPIYLNRSCLTYHEAFLS